MHTEPSATSDIAVELTPIQAKRIAETIRIELANQWDGGWFTPFPCREDIGRARSLLDACCEQLEELEWGEAAGNVELHSGRVRLEGLEHDLLEGAAACLADSGTNGGRRLAHQQSQDMIAAARAIREALERQAVPATR